MIFGPLIMFRVTAKEEISNLNQRHLTESLPMKMQLFARVYSAIRSISGRNLMYETFKII